jgi:hypothetical protein
VKRIDKFVTIVARSAVEAHTIANKTLAVASRRVVNPINQNDFRCERAQRRSIFFGANSLQSVGLWKSRPPTDTVGHEHQFDVVTSPNHA